MSTIVHRAWPALALLAIAGCTSGPTPPSSDADRPLTCSTAAAPPTASDRTAQLHPGGYVSVAAQPGARHAAGPGAAVIYLNASGATLRGGYDDATHDQSSVVAGAGKATVNYPAATFDPATWANLVACVTDEFARFNIQIVDARPQTAGYFMAMFGGDGTDVAANGYGGLAPIDSLGCSIIDGAVVFIFSDVLGNNAQLSCEVAAQEISHAFSLDHERLASDPMTYLSYGGHKTFQDQEAPCGENAVRPCICGRPSQSSVKILTQKVGLVGMPVDRVAPQATLTRPSDGDTLPVGAATITVHATDDIKVVTVTLHYLDSAGAIDADCGGATLPCTIAGDDYTFTVPNAHGNTNIYATAVDVGGLEAATPLIHVLYQGQPKPMAGAITIAVDPTSATPSPARVVTARATITTAVGAIAGATLAWTDDHGTVARYPMCPGPAATWSLPLHLGASHAARSLVVEAADTVGDQAASARLAVVNP